MLTSMLTEPRGELTRTASPSETPSAAASEGLTSMASPERIGEEYPADCAPVLYESRTLPVVSRRGN